MVGRPYPSGQQPADVSGPFASAWRVPLQPHAYTNPDHHATVCSWMIHAPQAHPLWTYYTLAIVHLRQLDGQSKPPTITVPGATHEFLIASLDPNVPLPDLDALGRGEATLSFLRPIDVIQQFTVRDDAEAHRLGDLAVRAIADGVISPDQDFRSAWRAAINDTAAHLRAGVHGGTERH